MQARWVAKEAETAPLVVERRPERVSARIERYALNNSGSPLYFVRAETGGVQRTVSLKFDQFRQLHRRLAEEGGVLYATAIYFPKPLRKARLGLRLTPSEIGEQCEGLNAWLRETTANIEELPLALQKEMRNFLSLDGSEPPAWTTAKTSTGGGLFAGAIASGRRGAAGKKKSEAVYPLGDSANLPGVTRRGRLECRGDRNTPNQWLSTHVILTHLSLLVFQPLDGDTFSTNHTVHRAASPPLLGAETSKSNEDAVESSRRSAAADSEANEFGAPGAHPFAAAIAESINGSGNTGESKEKQSAVSSSLSRASSQGRLLHNMHVTDILSILRHGDGDSVSAPPIHHRCFTITDLNDVAVTLRAGNGRDCLQWLKAIARAKDRALSAVHRLDDKSHGHELILATLKISKPAEHIKKEEAFLPTSRSNSSLSALLATAVSRSSSSFEEARNANTSYRRHDSVSQMAHSSSLGADADEYYSHVQYDERIVARGKPSMAYGWFEPLRVEVADATLRFELNAGEMEVRVGSLLERCVSDQAAGMGIVSSVAAAEAAASDSMDRAAFWAKVSSTESGKVEAVIDRSERLEVLLAVDASKALSVGQEWRSRRYGGIDYRSGSPWASILRGARQVCRDVARRLRRLFFVCFKNDTKVAAAVSAAVLSALFAVASRTRNSPPSSVATFTAYTQRSEGETFGWLVLLLADHSPGWTSDDNVRAAVVLSLPMPLAVLLATIFIFAACLTALFFGVPPDEDDAGDEDYMEDGTAYSDQVADIFRAAKHKCVSIDVRLVNWRWRDADSEDDRRNSALPDYKKPASVAVVRGRRQSNTKEDGHRTAKSISPPPSPRDVQKVEDPLPANVPARFLGAVRGDEALAEKRWAETVAFREAGNDPESVLRRPQPYYHQIKAKHRHFIHKTDKLGHIVAFEVVESPNKSFKELGNQGITVDAIVEHMHYVSAFTYVKILDDVDYVGVRPKDPQGYFLKIIDLKQIGLADCGGDTARYFRLVAAINRHYPERVWRTIIINAPSVFGVIWSIVSPLLEPNVREKITVLRSSYQDTLRELIDPDNLPVEYGGNDSQISPEEASMASFADEINAETAAASAAEAAASAAEAAASAAAAAPGETAASAEAAASRMAAEERASSSSSPSGSEDPAPLRNSVATARKEEEFNRTTIVGKLPNRGFSELFEDMPTTTSPEKVDSTLQRRPSSSLSDLEDSDEAESF